VVVNVDAKGVGVLLLKLKASNCLFGS